MTAESGGARSVLGVAFAHHVWATIRVIEACEPLGEDDLTRDLTSSGLFGSILATLQHLVASDAWYLAAITETDDATHLDDASLAQLRDAMEQHHSAWQAITAHAVDGTRIVTQRGPRWTTTAPLAYRLAQVLHHGSDHRSQVCTALTLCSHPTPETDLWDFGLLLGDVTDTPTEGAAR